MAKLKTAYICQNCGYQSSKWLGKCPDCNSWNQLVEEAVTAQPVERKVVKPGPKKLSEIIDEGSKKRMFSGIQELDRVLGGGIFPASVILLAGEPGIGKSTLMLQMMLKLPQEQGAMLYISGEESFQQIKNRAARLKPLNDDILILAETDVVEIQYQIEQVQPKVVVIDSIQAIYHPELSGTPGNVGQVRECAARLFKQAKEQSLTLFLVGHITKEGLVAGPKILEHLVDVVIHFESNTRQHRMIRSIKNRFGAANELGIFEMCADGLKEVCSISGLFLNLHHTPKVGSSVVCSYEGTRPLMIEIQALVNHSGYGTPQRTVSGFDQRRLALILAILEKFCRQNFSSYDVFVKIAGGVWINDPAIDLGVAVALYSGLRELPMDTDALYIGELGLGGEVRPVTFIEKRLQEAEKMGFKQAYIAERNFPEKEKPENSALLLSPVALIHELLLPLTQSTSKK